MEQLEKAVRGKLEFPETLWHNISPAAKDLVSGLLHPIVGVRLTVRRREILPTFYCLRTLNFSSQISRAMQHPWLQAGPNGDAVGAALPLAGPLPRQISDVDVELKEGLPTPEALAAEDNDRKRSMNHLNKLIRSVCVGEDSGNVLESI